MYEEDHGTFKSHSATRKLSSLGLHVAPPRKNQIFPVRIDEKFASDEGKVSQALMVFNEMADLSHSFAKLPELQTLRIDSISQDALPLKNFGLN